MTKTFTLVAGFLAATTLPTLAHDADKLAELPPGDPYKHFERRSPFQDAFHCMRFTISHLSCRESAN